MTAIAATLGRVTELGFPDSVTGSFAGSSANAAQLPWIWVTHEQFGKYCEHADFIDPQLKAELDAWQALSAESLDQIENLPE
jgi:hypothetical protein